MKPTQDLSSKTKTELKALARRKKITVPSGILKDDLIKAIKRGLRKIEAQKKSKITTTQKRKQTSASKAAKKTTKKKSSKRSKAATGLKPKSNARKKVPAQSKTKKSSIKKSAPRKPKTARSPKTVQRQVQSKPVEINLPDRYKDHRLVVLARDPNWAYAYWDLNPTRVRDLLKSAGQTPAKARWILRVYSAAKPPMEEKGSYFDVDNVVVEGGNYYLNLARPGARFIVEIGVIDASGLFRPTAKSDPVILPLDHPSEIIAQESTFTERPPALGGSSFIKPLSSGSH